MKRNAGSTALPRFVCDPRFLSAGCLVAHTPSVFCPKLWRFGFSLFFVPSCAPAALTFCQVVFARFFFLEQLGLPFPIIWAHLPGYRFSSRSTQSPSLSTFSNRSHFPLKSFCPKFFAGPVFFLSAPRIFLPFFRGPLPESTYRSGISQASIFSLGSSPLSRADLFHATNRTQGWGSCFFRWLFQTEHLCRLPPLSEPRECLLGSFGAPYLVYEHS